MTTPTEITLSIADVRTLLAIAYGRLEDAKAHVTDLEQVLNSVQHKLSAARDVQARAQDSYDRVCKMLEY